MSRRLRRTIEPFGSPGEHILSASVLLIFRSLRVTASSILNRSPFRTIATLYDLLALANEM